MNSKTPAPKKTPPEDTSIVCGDCGKHSPQGTKNCPNCGYEL